MLSSIIAVIHSAFTAVGRFFDWLSGERLRKLGRIEEQLEQRRLEEWNANIAKKLDAEPMPSDVADILAGMRRPSKK